ncbi:hypothetical protein O0I10_012381 [Lichtheimia ornata]|uniref:Uncharacterized protein n=1 Tax=Lichtheimia ornata TaxID=688661 RepID=A0AAD7XT92_9FUNG|nr:uncharacterized protein O0I10_012381 [Lichtheimia ornata]KAJ8652011.1 hypothetical protein O0I10_012381 [Lichtheimia ornata]
MKSTFLSAIMVLAAGVISNVGAFQWVNMVDYGHLEDDCFRAGVENCTYQNNYAEDVCDVDDSKYRENEHDEGFD